MGGLIDREGGALDKNTASYDKNLFVRGRDWVYFFHGADLHASKVLHLSTKVVISVRSSVRWGRGPSDAYDVNISRDQTRLGLEN